MFELIDFAAIFKIIGIDIMLGADNAIVIALACAALPLTLRNKAMFLGTVGAIGVRAIALIAAGFLLLIPGLKIVAGAFLLYVGYQLLNDHDNEDNIESPEGMMAAVKTIIIADLMMSIDNVMAVAGAAQSAGPLAIYYSIAGILFSIPIIVLGAKYLTTLMDKFPIIIWLGAGLLGWVGAEMVISDSFVIEHVKNTEWLYKIAGFFAVILAVVASKHFNKTESNV